MTWHTYSTAGEAADALVASFKRCVAAAEAGDPESSAKLALLRNLTRPIYFPDPNRKPARDPYEDSVVYYVENHGLIKIGTSCDVERRLYAIGGKVLATEPGSYGLERERHHQFTDSRVGRTEWFQPTPALRQHIAGLVTGGGRSPLPPPVTS